MRKAILFQLFIFFSFLGAMEDLELTLSDVVFIETAYRIGVRETREGNVESICHIVSAFAGRHENLQIINQVPEKKLLEVYLPFWHWPIYMQRYEEYQDVAERDEEFLEAVTGTFHKKHQEGDDAFFLEQLKSIRNFCAFAQKIIGQKKPLLTVAIEAFQGEFLKELLAKMIIAGADPDGLESDFYLARPLYRAAELDDADAIHMLAKYKANIKGSYDLKGFRCDSGTPLARAIGRGVAHSVQELLIFESPVYKIDVENAWYLLRRAGHRLGLAQTREGTALPETPRDLVDQEIEREGFQAAIAGYKAEIERRKVVVEMLKQKLGIEDELFADSDTM